MTTALISWSGGKDSCLALWRARNAGMAVPLLVTAMDEDGRKSRSHGVPPALRAAKAEGIGHAIFGDIDLQPHRDWEEKVCGIAGLTAHLPLWGGERRALVDEFLAAGFKAIVVCINGRHLPREFCGREFDAAFLADLPPGVDACGENGEFHTFVYDGPAFSTPVALRRTQVLQYDAPADLGGATYYFQELAPA